VFFLSSPRLCSMQHESLEGHDTGMNSKKIIQPSFIYCGAGEIKISCGVGAYKLYAYAHLAARVPYPT
jgi:hypothetical protein